MQKQQKNLKINKKKLEYIYIYVHCNIKNTLISLTKSNGDILKQWSTKSLQKKEQKKNNPYNIQLILNQLKKYLYIKKFYNILIFFKGIGIARYNIIKNLKSKNKKIRIIFISDLTKIPFNGCRQKKLKRR